MIDSKNKVLKSILGSANGLHLTTYIKFDGNVLSFQRRLRKLLKTPKSHLESVLTDDQVEKFLAPFEALARDTTLLKQMSGNIGIFRKNNFFRFLSLPIEIEEMSVVANTFHIKPLVKWAQYDQEFILVGLKEDGAVLYKGSQSEFKKLNEVQHSSSQWLEDLNANTNSVVFVAGAKELVKTFIRNYKSEKLYPETIAIDFADDKAFEISKKIRSVLRLDSQTKMADTIGEFIRAKNSGFTKANIFQIAKAAIKGNVRKLIVAEDYFVFGKLDRLSGGLEINPLDLDHEDDCLLDDIAQAVLLNGGEVIVAKKNEIPGGKVIMAILNKGLIELSPKNFRQIEIAV